MPTSTDLQRAIQLVDDLFAELSRCFAHNETDAPDIRGLQDVLYTLEEVQSTHDYLDKLDVPRQSAESGEMNLISRVEWLASNRMGSNHLEMRKDFYGGVFPLKVDQRRLFERRQKYRHRGDVAEFKIRLKDDHRPWMEIPLHGDLLVDTFSVPPGEAAQIVAKYLANNTPHCKEVRWNWRGSLQGHYVPGPGFGEMRKKGSNHV